MWSNRMRRENLVIFKVKNLYHVAKVKKYLKMNFSQNF